MMRVPCPNRSFPLFQIAELYRRGWNKYELGGLTGGNLLRILRKAEGVSHKLRAAGALPKYDIYEKRTDL
jgi:membrane dipeptidase